MRWLEALLAVLCSAALLATDSQANDDLEQVLVPMFAAAERPLLEAIDRMPRSNETRVISFGLYGTKPKYLIGAIRNAQLAKVFYPGWTARFYHSAEVRFASAGPSVPMPPTVADTRILPPPTTTTLPTHTYHRCRRCQHYRRRYRDVQVPARILDELREHAAELILMGSHGGIDGMFWRFYVAADPAVDRYVIVSLRRRHTCGNLARSWIMPSQPPIRTHSFLPCHHTRPSATATLGSARESVSPWRSGSKTAPSCT